MRLEPAENLIKNLLEAANQQYAQQLKSQRCGSDRACKALNRNLRMLQAEKRQYEDEPKQLVEVVELKLVKM